MAFYDIYLHLCRERGITPTQAGRENGIKQQTVSHWKKRNSTPNAEVILRLANYFKTTPAYLLGNDPEEISQFIEESELGYNTTHGIADYISQNPTIARDSAVGEVIFDYEFQGLIQNLILSLVEADDEKRGWLIQIMSGCLKINKKHNLTSEQASDLSSVIDNIDTAISTDDSELFKLVSKWVTGSLNELRHEIKNNYNDNQPDTEQED